MGHLADWQWFALYLTGFGLWVFLAGLFIDDKESRVQWQAGGMLWPFFAFGAAMAAAMALAVSPFLALTWFANKARIATDTRTAAKDR